MFLSTTARRGTAIIASLGATALLTLSSQSVTHASGSRDSETDGMPNRWEVRHHLNAHHANAKGNPDHDGLNNLGEFRHDTLPHDGDGVEDGAEDSDGDGIDNADDDEDDEDDDCQGDEDSGDDEGGDDRALIMYVVR